ncbi:elongation factor 1-beta isoform X2 [Cetorhinus maximus]
MGFGDLKSASGLKVLNDYLADRSYIEGYVPSQADIAVFEALDAPPSADFYHALRWYNHILSYESTKSCLPGVKQPLGKYGPQNVADTTPAKAVEDDDDDDIDLFGSDDEEESAEAKRIKEERLAQYEAKKSKTKLVPVGYGIKKLQIQCVVEDDKVGTDMLEETITAFEDYVQSVDVAAFNKV